MPNSKRRVSLSGVAAVSVHSNHYSQSPAGGCGKFSWLGTPNPFMPEHVLVAPMLKTPPPQTQPVYVSYYSANMINIYTAFFLHSAATCILFLSLFFYLCLAFNLVLIIVLLQTTKLIFSTASHQGHTNVFKRFLKIFPQTFLNIYGSK